MKTLLALACLLALVAGCRRSDADLKTPLYWDQPTAAQKAHLRIVIAEAVPHFDKYAVRLTGDRIDAYTIDEVPGMYLVRTKATVNGVVEPVDAFLFAPPDGRSRPWKLVAMHCGDRLVSFPKNTHLFKQ